MKVQLSLDKSTKIIDTEDGRPVIPMGFDIALQAGIENSGSNELTIEDPGVTQRILIHLKSDHDTSETMFLLNPSQTDALGEVTAPPRKELVLKPSGSTRFTVYLYAHAMDKVFTPAIISMSFSYDNYRSAPVIAEIRFTEESVGRLLEFLNDPKTDLWIRKESFRWLKKIKPDFTYNFNENSTDNFRYWWEEQKENRKTDSIIGNVE